MIEKQLLTPYESQGHYGLLHGIEVALPARYDAVWALPYGFWGFRMGERFGVLAAGGELVSACVLPAVLQGFAELTVEEELELFLEPEGSYVPYVRSRLPDLHQRFRVLCRPATWLAEDITPYLLEQDEEHEEPCGLWLYAEDCTLELRPNGTWTRHNWTHTVPRLYYQRQLPAHSFTTTVATSVQPAEVEDLLRWRLRLRELAEPGTDLLGGGNMGWMLADAQQQASCVAGLQELLQAAGIQKIGAAEEASLPPCRTFDLAALPASTRTACEEHLNTIFEVDADSQVYVEQLIYLAWLWANDFVFYDPEDGLHWVDGRYEFDNSLFDHAIIDTIYQDYELHLLLALLRLPTLP